MTHTKLIYCFFGVAAWLAACDDDSSNDNGTGGRSGTGGGFGMGGGFGQGGILGGGGNGGVTGFGGGTGGSGGGSGGAGGASAADGGLNGDGAVDAPMGGPIDAPVNEGDVAIDAGQAPVCGPFANGGSPIDAGAAPSPTMSFFVSSSTSVNGNLGGLAGADQRCQALAAAVGLASPLWRAYLSVEHEPAGTGPAVNARDRIGTGPWYNAQGAILAADLDGLHARKGDPSLFLDEHGNMINGNWTGSGTPVEHDILTGSNPDGTVAVGKTCADWTSADGPTDGAAPDGGGGLVARVGHSDGIGPRCNLSTSPIDYTSWNSSHDNAGCNNTLPRGGAGRIYCFKANE